MGMVVRKFFSATFDATADDRTFSVTLSTPRTDRDNDTIPVAGWIHGDTVPLCWSHDTQQFPLGLVRLLRRKTIVNQARLLLLGILFMLLGIQVLTTGLIGEMITFKNFRRRDSYSVKERVE